MQTRVCSPIFQCRLRSNPTLSHLLCTRDAHSHEKNSDCVLLIALIEVKQLSLLSKFDPLLSKLCEKNKFQRNFSKTIPLRQFKSTFVVKSSSNFPLNHNVPPNYCYLREPRDSFSFFAVFFPLRGRGQSGESDVQFHLRYFIQTNLQIYTQIYFFFNFIKKFEANSLVNKSHSYFQCRHRF